MNMCLSCVYLCCWHTLQIRQVEDWNELKMILRYPCQLMQHCGWVWVSCLNIRAEGHVYNSVTRHAERPTAAVIR